MLLVQIRALRLGEVEFFDQDNMAKCESELDRNLTFLILYLFLLEGQSEIPAPTVNTPSHFQDPSQSPTHMEINQKFWFVYFWS